MNNFQRNIYRIVDSDSLPPTVFSFTAASGSGTTGYTTSCPVGDYTQTYHCGDNPIIVGSVIYEDAVGGTEVVGANLWYKEEISQITYRIDNLGVVTALYSCV